MLITDIYNVKCSNKKSNALMEKTGETCNNIKTRICFETFLSSFDSCNIFKLVN